MLDVGIRSVEDSDEDALDAIYAACIAKRPDIKGVYSSEIQDLTVPEYQRDWKADGWPVLVATLDGLPVGIACLMPTLECPNSLHMAEVAIMAQPSLHRQAIATKLWKGLLSAPALSEKCLQVILAKVASTNAQAINACVKAGFRHTGSMPQAYCTPTSRTLRDMLYFEFRPATTPPDVSHQGWVHDYPGKVRIEKLLHDLTIEDLEYQSIRGDASKATIQGMCEISSHLAATTLFPLLSQYSAQHHSDVKSVLSREDTIAIVIFKKNSERVVGHAKLRRGSSYGDEAIMNALLHMCLPEPIQTKEVVLKIWSMLLEANQSLKGLRITSVYAIAAQEDIKLRSILEEALDMRKAYTLSCEFVKFGKLRGTITYTREIERFDHEQLKIAQKAHGERNAAFQTEELRERLAMDAEEEQRKQSWSYWAKRKMGVRTA